MAKHYKNFLWSYVWPEEEEMEKMLFFLLFVVIYYLGSRGDQTG